MKTPLLTLVLASCTPAGGDLLSRPHRPASQAPSATVDANEPGEVSLQIACTLDSENALRAWCDVVTEPPSAVDLRFWKSDGSGAERVHRGAAGDDRIGLYIMSADAEYSWEATVPADPGVVATGTFHTEIPPDGATIGATINGASSADHFLMASPCLSSGLAVVMTTDGDVVWYQQFSDRGEPLVALSWTEDGTLLGLTISEVVEVDWMGSEKFSVLRGTDFTEDIHHDLFKRNGHIYVLFQERAFFFDEEYIMDGLLVFDPTGAIEATWHLQDVFEPPAPSGRLGAIDYTHANALFVAEDGDILFSMRHLSAVAKLNGDLSSPDFGDILWRLSGDQDNLDFGSDFEIDEALDKGDASFAMQHNVQWLPDGRLALFDNRAISFQDSRVLVIDIDEGAGVADVQDIYQLDQHCRFQGGAWHTAAGNPVATCAPSNEMYEFAPGAFDTPVYDARYFCDAGSDAFIPRVIPVIP